MTLSVGETPLSGLFAQVYRACPLCGAEEVEYELLIDKTAISRCRACSLLFSNPAQVTQMSPVDVAAPPYPTIRRFAESVLGRPSPSCLVVGAVGAPGSDDTCLPDAVPAGRCFDIVIAYDVVQYSADPVAFIESLRGVLADDGVLVVVAPSIASPRARTMLDTWPYFRTKARWYFDVDTIAHVLTRGGFGRFVSVTSVSDLPQTPTNPADQSFGSYVAVAARAVSRTSLRKLSVVVPVFNEASTVAELLDAVLAKEIPDTEIEIIIVESNSSDGSREIVKRYADHPRVRAVFEDRPRGKGFAVRTALRHATGDVILFQDADLEYDIQDYDRLVEPLFRVQRNFVLGSRHGATGEGWKIRRFQDRKLTGIAMNIAHLGLLTMSNRLYRQSLFDPFTMYKVFRRDCLEALSFECDRFDFDYEICIKLIRKGFQPLELPVNYRSRSFSEGKKVAFFRDPPTWVRAMLRLRTSRLYDL